MFLLVFFIHVTLLLARADGAEDCESPALFSVPNFANLVVATSVTNGRSVFSLSLQNLSKQHREKNTSYCRKVRRKAISLVFSWSFLRFWSAELKLLVAACFFFLLVAGSC